MFTKIEDFLAPQQAAEWVSRIEPLAWEDSELTMPGADNRNNNEELTMRSQEAVPALQAASKFIMRHSAVKSWAEPRRISSIMFYRYGEGASYGSHSDTAINHFFPIPHAPISRSRSS